MSNELTKQQENVLALVGEQGIDKVLKPLTREIHLFDSFIAGTGYLKDQAPLAALREGDKLILRREDNKFDDNAILLLNAAGVKLGYVPERDNVIFARLLDAGKCLSATVAHIEHKGSYWQISVGIYLIDF